MKLSVIIPVFNEQLDIEDCLHSLLDQSFPDFEIIVVDDGSSDKTVTQVKQVAQRSDKILLLCQNHLGPGPARNLGAKKATGEILVFVDADMTFDSLFLDKLTKPIREQKAVGTFSKEEFLSNASNVWSKCWNINKGLPVDRMHPPGYPNEQKVFRAIKREEFDKSGGFDPIGYIDDFTISEKLGISAKLANGAIFYHKNPSTLKEVFIQALWVGSSEYKRRKISNESLMRLVSILRYSIIFSLINGIKKGIKFKVPLFLVFKLIYDLAIEIALFRSFFSKKSAK